jgi:hypothetical protein
MVRVDKKKSAADIFGPKLGTALRNFGRIAFQERPLESKAHPVGDLWRLKTGEIKKFAKSGSVLQLEAVMEHTGSAVMGVGKSVPDLYEGPLTSGRRVTPFTVMGFYKYKHPYNPYKRGWKEIVVLWERKHNLPAEKDQLSYVIEVLSRMEREKKAVLPKRLDTFPTLGALWEEFREKRGEFRIEGVNLANICKPEGLFNALRESEMLRIHKSRIEGESKFGITDRHAITWGQFRKVSSQERKALKALGMKVKRGQFVFALTRDPEELKDKSPHELLRWLRPAKPALSKTLRKPILAPSKALRKHLAAP